MDNLGTNNILNISFAPFLEKDKAQEIIKEFSQASYGNNLIPNSIKLSLISDHNTQSLIQIQEDDKDITPSQMIEITPTLELTETPILILGGNFDNEEKSNSNYNDVEILESEIENKNIK
jgi:hypothetical protein